ncbi:disulfide-isomerase A6 family [Trichomonas vaginalis G3]|nr:disulfide-isomerase A6 family [Trichomonas vaginalis G3]KAI5507606.1 disulfide-isomerase A6 family [Trichomonas vaginalis G3]
MIKFISLDIEENPKLAHLHTVRQAPAFRIITSSSSVEYRDEHVADAFIKAATKYIKNYAQTIDASWAPSAKTPLSAILITNKKAVPPYWAALSNKYYEANIRIGVNRNPAITELFGVKEQNCILFVFNNIVSVYEGQLTFTAIDEALEKFVANPSQSGTTDTLIGELDSKERIDTLCHNTGKVCVLEASQEPSNEYRDAATNNKDDRFKFYVCGKNCPFNNMKGYYIFHHRNDKAMKVETIQELPTALDHVVDGTARYSLYQRLFKNNEDL